MKKLTLPTALTLPQKLPQTRSLPTIGAVATLPRLPSFNAEAIKQTEEQQFLLRQQQAKEASYKQVGGLRDPNDPYVLNSFSDAIFNRKAKEKRYGEFAEVLHKIPVLGDLITAIPAAVDVGIVQPFTNLFKGDFKALGINALTGFSETADILANPVKALITPLVNQDTADRRYQLPWYERLGSGFGFTDEGRYNYDYDTGFWLADLGLEIISDPLNVIELIVAAYTGGSNIAAKQGAKAAAKQMGKEAVGEFAEKVAKELGEEISEEAIGKLATKKIAKQMIEDTAKLRKLGVKISSATKAIAKSKADNGLKILAQNLDTALSKSKGIVDSNVKSIVNSIVDAVKQYDDIPKAILKDFDDFTTASKYTLKDIFGDSLGAVLNKSAYSKTVEINKQIAEAAAKGDNALVAQLRENLKLILSDPASIKKYKKGIEISTDALELLDKIELTDYMNGLNGFVMDHNNFKLFNALDKIGSITEAADKGILVAALMSSPVTQALYFGSKSGIGKKLGSLVSRFLIRRLSDITDWINGKTVVQALFEVDTALEASRNVVKKFSIFSGEELFHADFGKEYAYNVYSKTLNWLRGFGDPEQYVLSKTVNKATGNVEEIRKPVNILLLPLEEQKAHILFNFGSEIPENIDQNAVVDYFYRRFNEVGHFGNTGVYLQNWDIAEYIKAIQVDDATAKLQQLYSDFTQTLTKSENALSSPQAYLKFINDLDTPVAKTTLAHTMEALNNYAPLGSEKAYFLTLNEDFKSIEFDLKDTTKKEIAKSLFEIDQISKELTLHYNDLEVLKQTGAEYSLIRKQLNLIQDTQFKLRSQITNIKNKLRKIPKQHFDQTLLSKLYPHFEKILSPYFGKEEVLVENTKVLYEVRGNARYITHKVLENKDFQNFITAFKAGNDGAKLLEANLAEANSKLAALKMSAPKSSDFSSTTAFLGKNEENLIVKAKEFMELQTGQVVDYDEVIRAKNAASARDHRLKAISELEKEIHDYTRIQQFFQSIDNYVEHVALVKQSNLPELLEEVYFDTLQNLQVKDAGQFLKSFETNFADTIRQINIGLSGRYQTHHFTLEYYATKLLENPEYSNFAKTFLSSNRSASERVEFMDILFKANIVPELSKTRSLTINGKEVKEFVNTAWNDIKSKSLVYLDFNATGTNAAIDTLQDIAFYSPATADKWAKTVDNTTNEIEVLLEFYRNIRAIYDANKAQDTVFIFQNSQSFNIDFINTRFMQAEELAQAVEDFELFGNLQSAREWLLDHLYSRSLDNIDLLKQLEGIPTVGKYYSDIKRILHSAVANQARVDSSVMLYLDEHIFDLLDSFPPLDPIEYKEVKNSLINLMHSCNDAKYTWSARMGVTALDGTFLIDGDVYKPTKSLIFDDKDSITQALQSNEVYIPDKTELIELKENRWVYKNQQLPEDIATANDAVRYLKKQGIDYAPSWQALNLRQQLSTYPVLINGNVSLQTIEGIAPVAFRRHIDTDLVSDFFNVAKASFAEQHTLTRLSQQMSNVLARIKNTILLEQHTKDIEQIYEKVFDLLKNNSSYTSYSLLKENLDIYHKFAVLVVLAKDTDIGALNKRIRGIINSPVIIPEYVTYSSLRLSNDSLLKGSWKDLKYERIKAQRLKNTEAKILNDGRYKAENESRSEFAKMIYKPEYFVYSKSRFAEIFDEYDRVSQIKYHTLSYSRNEYLEHIYDAEKKGMTVYARDLKNALAQSNKNILNATESLKRGLDENKIYAPVIQRHGTIGQAHIDLNNVYIELVENFRDGLELDTFIACDKQLVNNLEDLLLNQVLKMSPKDLTSFVYHQGKGVVIIPVSGYLTDTSKHSFDLTERISAFSNRYQNYEDEFIRVIKADGDLIVFAKDYKKNMQRQVIEYSPLDDIDYDKAFRGAFGYPNNWEAFRENAMSLRGFEEIYYSKQAPEIIKKYTDARKELEAIGISAKQVEFLATHIEEIEKLRQAHLRHHQEFIRLAIDYDDQYSYMLGGYGRIMDSSAVSELYNALPDEVRLNVFGGEIPEKTFYNTSEHMFNFSTLGRAAYRKKYEHFATSNYQSLMAQSYRALNNNLSTAAQYASFYYNAKGTEEFVIPQMFNPANKTYDSLKESPWNLNSIFGDTMPDEDIYETLKNQEEFTLSYLGIDKKGLPHVETIPISSIADIEFARTKGAILLPSTTFNSVAQTINNKRWANSKFKLFHKINYFLKACMLIHPGFIFRNFIDSTLKNFLVSKDPGSMVNSYYDALTYYTRYKETVNMLFAINPDSPFRPDTLKVVFEDSTAPMSEELFMLVHNFIESGPSAGSIDKVSKFYLKKAAKPSLINQVYDTLLQPTKGLEQITRLAEYLEFIKKGMTNTDAFQLITKTHFDYAAKTGTTRLIEFVIPFYSFQAKNFEFWLDFLNKSPVLAYVLSKYFQSVWNWEELDFDRIDAYQSQLNHIMQANIQLNKQGLTLKVNPSFMDPINILANPIDSFTSRVSPIFKPIVDAMQGKEPYNYEQLAGTVAGAAASAIPGVGGVIGGATAIASQTAGRYESGYRSYQRTGSPLPLIAPSIFGSVKTPAQYGRASYTNSRAFMDPQKRVPRRVSTYNKLYTDTGKNRWQLRYLPVDHFTVQWRIRESTNRFR